MLPVSLVIASRNRGAMLLDSIRSVLEGDEIPAQLIVADQSDEPLSIPADVAVSERTELVYLHLSSRGLSRGNNSGIAAATQETVVLTHDDVLVAPDWLRALVGALRAAPPRTVVTGRIAPGAPEESGGFAPGLEDHDDPAVYEGRIFADVLHPASMAVARSAFDEVGGFDERLGPGTRFPAAEDNDLGYRLLEVGYRIQYVPEAVLRHRAWRRREDFLPLRWAYGRGQGAYYAKHMRLRDPYMVRRVGRNVGPRLRRTPESLLHQRRRAAADAFYVAGLASGAVEWWLRHGRSRG